MSDDHGRDAYARQRRAVVAETGLAYCLKGAHYAPADHVRKHVGADGRERNVCDTCAARRIKVRR